MQDESKYIRQVQTSVNNFIHCGDEYLFMKRSMTKRVDPGRLNTVGGRVEPGENFLDAVMRETKEETGYVVNPQAIQFSGVVKLEGGYDEDWVMCFFKTPVTTKDIPAPKSDDGELMWLHKDKVIDSEFELVDDLKYLFKDIVEGSSILFATAKLTEDQKIATISIGKLKS